VEVKIEVRALEAAHHIFRVEDNFHLLTDSLILPSLNPGKDTPAVGHTSSSGRMNSQMSCLRRSIMM
jgi:hypothetical protein